MKPRTRPFVPADTKEIGGALLKPGDPLRIVGDQLGDFVNDEDFAELYSVEGKPAISPGLLAMVCVLQAMECLSDRMAVHMVVNRIDWKYALRLPLGYKGFDASVLCEFRERLAKPGTVDQIVFERLLERAKALGLLNGRRQRTDSVSILSCAAEQTRLEMVREALRLGLDGVARLDAIWVVTHVAKEILEAYAEPLDHSRLVHERGEKGIAAARRMMREIGEHGQWLMQQLEETHAPIGAKSLVAIQTLKTIWQQQYRLQTDRLELREKLETAGKDVIQTPHDPEARHSQKRQIGWTGYKNHNSESVPEDPESCPRLLTDMLTTEATTSDRTSLEEIQQRLAERGLKPDEHLVDTGYISGPAIQRCQEQGIDLVGPIQEDSSQQAKVGFGLDRFTIDYERKQATCPQGHVSIRWWDQAAERNTPRTNVQFDPAVCQVCPCFKQCVIGKSRKARTLRIGQTHEITRQRRIDQRTPEFRQRYRKRAGNEATISLMVRRYAMRKSKYVGLAKTALRNLMIGSAINLTRIASFLAGQRPVVRPASLLRKIANAMAA